MVLFLLSTLPPYQLDAMFFYQMEMSSISNFCLYLVEVEKEARRYLKVFARIHVAIPYMEDVFLHEHMS